MEIEYKALRRGEDRDWAIAYPESITRIRFINSLYQVYINRDCMGISMALGDCYTFFCQKICSFQFSSSPQVLLETGRSFLKLSLLYYICCKYGGYRIRYEGNFYNVPILSPSDVDDYLDNGTLGNYFPFLSEVDLSSLQAVSIQNQLNLNDNVLLTM